ncbi:MAG: GWxTD domain-containing protein [Candidatus Aminicenantes bacterium]|nr:GWxTD domain-containing protein [Candidatus Aminicenantes bacterium]
MKKTTVAFIALALCLSLGAESEKELIKKLPPHHRRWLTEEVVYIITKVEKEVFLHLESDRERDTFISAFWKQRNPNPNLPENEFKKEHYRRIAYANNWFGKDSPAPGWRTDMGRVYITLGEPHQIERFESDNEIYPTVVWFYQGMASKGLPDSFNVVFFKQHGLGEYELYSPVKYGPQALMRNYEGDATSYLDAYYALLDIQPQLAAVSLSLISGEPIGITPSLASELLIREKIPETPQRAIKDIYASNFLKFKGQVEIEYADNFMESSSQLNVVRDRSGYYFVHYLIEPKRLSFEEHQGKYYTTLEISGNVSDRSGNMLTQISRRIPVELSESQLRKVKDKLFSFQDMLPVIPGRYRLTVFLKNLTTREFTTMEKDFAIPASEALAMSPPLLANRKVDVPGSPEYKPFRFGTSHLLPSPRNDFLASDDLVVFLQLHGLSAKLLNEGALEYSLVRRGETALSRKRALREYPSLPDVIETIPLKGQSAAYYTLTVSLHGAGGKALLSESAEFYITPQPALPRPWVLSVPTAVDDFPNFLNELGRQYLQVRKLDQALPLLERAFRRQPDNTRFGVDYCQLLLRRGEFAKVKEIALPMVSDRSQFEYCLPLGRACQGLGEFAEAIAQYAEHITRFGANVGVFNQIGECHFHLGDEAQALKAWEKSLSLNPKQPQIREKVDALRKTTK